MLDSDIGLQTQSRGIELYDGSVRSHRDEYFWPLSQLVGSRSRGAGDDYDPFGTAAKKEPQGIARKTADDRIREQEAKLVQADVRIEKYATAQDHPGLTYDPELLGEQVRVMTGEQYDRLVQAEAQANRTRYETEKAIRCERGDLLVPMRTAHTVEVNASIATATTTS